MPLARRLAARYRGGGEPLEDLIQVASVGLLGALERYDPGRGVTLEAFAIPTILGQLKRHFRDAGWAAHVPRTAQEIALRVARAESQLTAQTGRTPHAAQLAEHLGVGVQDTVGGLKAGGARCAASLNAPARDSGDDPESLVDRLGAIDDGYALVEISMALGAAVAHLPQREPRALAMRVADDGLNQAQIAARMGCSQMQVSQLLRRSAQRLEEVAQWS